MSHEAIETTRERTPLAVSASCASTIRVTSLPEAMRMISGGPPEIILIASGSEVTLIVEAHEALLAKGVRSRVVSMASWDIFEHQPQAYREEVLPPSVKTRLAVEQASALGWERYVGDQGRVIGMKAFGASAPLKELQRKFGFEPEKVVAVALEMLGRT